MILASILFVFAIFVIAELYAIYALLSKNMTTYKIMTYFMIYSQFYRWKFIIDSIRASARIEESKHSYREISYKFSHIEPWIREYNHIQDLLIFVNENSKVVDITSNNPYFALFCAWYI